MPTIHLKSKLHGAVSRVKTKLRQLLKEQSGGGATAGTGNPTTGKPTVGNAPSKLPWIKGPSGGPARK